MKSDRAKNQRIAMHVQELHQEWMDSLMLTGEYVRFLIREGSHGRINQPTDWQELKDAHKDHQTYQTAYTRFKELLAKDNPDSALRFASSVLNATTMEEVESLMTA